MLYFVASEQALGEVMRIISRRRVVYAPVPEPADQQEGEKANFHLERAETWDAARHTIAPYRTVEPLKQVVFPPREFLGRLWENGTREPEERVVIGVKNCDLAALRVHDYVFLESPPDNGYAALRRNTLIVSADCTDCRDVCFCSAVGEQPYPVKGFDINISPIPDGWLLEAGSERGERLLGAASDLLQEAGEEQKRQRDEARSRLREKVQRRRRSTGWRRTRTTGQRS